MSAPIISPFNDACLPDDVLALALQNAESSDVHARITRLHLGFDASPAPQPQQGPTSVPGASPNLYVAPEAHTFYESPRPIVNGHVSTEVPLAAEACASTGPGALGSPPHLHPLALGFRPHFMREVSAGDLGCIPSMPIDGSVVCSAGDPKRLFVHIYIDPISNRYPSQIATRSPGVLAPRASGLAPSLSRLLFSRRARAVSGRVLSLSYLDHSSESSNDPRVRSASSPVVDTLSPDRGRRRHAAGRASRVAVATCERSPQSPKRELQCPNANLPPPPGPAS